MDATAITMCMESNLPILVFKLDKAGSVLSVLKDNSLGTKVVNNLGYSAMNSLLDNCDKNMKKKQRCLKRVFTFANRQGIGVYFRGYKG